MTETPTSDSGHGVELIQETPPSADPEELKGLRRRRNPWIGGVLSLLLQGLGHLYDGKPLLALTSYAATQLLAVLAAFVLVGSVTGLIAAVLLGIGWWLAVAAHSAILARRAGEISLRWYNRWYVYVLLILANPFLTSEYATLLSRVSRYRAYVIRASSMEDTLLVGDHIIVDAWCFKKHLPGRGDVVTVGVPEVSAKEFVKRVVGLPGDSLEVRKKALVVNGNVIRESYVCHKDPHAYSPLDVDARPEALIRDNFGPVKVPPGSLFVMGDNRDNSHDSRYWGYLPEANLTGRPLIIYWSYTADTGVRWERVLSEIR